MASRAETHLDEIPHLTKRHHAGLDDYKTVSPPPSAPLPHQLTFRKPHDTGMPAILAGILIPHIVTTLFLLGRLISRCLQRHWRASDTLIVLAWSTSTALSTIYAIASHTPAILLAPSEPALQRDVRPGAVHPFIMRTYLGLLFYQATLILTKLSILSFYLPLLGRRGRRVAQATLVFVAVYAAPLLFMSIFQCHPRAGQFFGRAMACVGLRPLIIASAALHTATDAWIIALGVPALSRARLPYAQKVAAAAALSSGIFVVAAALLRLQLGLRRDFGPGSVGVTNTLSFFVLTVLECDVAIICACAPTLRDLVGRVWPRFLGDEAAVRRLVEERGAGGGGGVVVVERRRRGHPWMGDLVPPRARADEETGSSGSRGGTAGESRPVSLGFEEYFLRLAEQPLPRIPQGSRRAAGTRDVVAAARWDCSQESFVLGVDDPRHARASPSTLGGPRECSRAGSADRGPGSVGGASGRASSRGADSPTELLGK